MNWGIIELDFIADDFANVLEERNQNYWVYSDDKEKLIEFNKQHPNSIIHTNYDELLKEVDIIYISTYVNKHRELIEKAFEYNIHVFSEKCMFKNAADATWALNIAKEKQLFIGEANTLFYMPLYKELSNCIKEGQLGNLKMIRAEFGSLKDEQSDYQLFDSKLGGGALYDIGIYALTAVMQYMQGEIVDISNFSKQHVNGVDEQWIISLKSKSMLAGVNLSIKTKLSKRLVIAGDQAYLEIYNYPRGDNAKLVYPDGTEKQFNIGNTKNAVAYEIEEVENNIKNNNLNNDTMLITIKVMELMDALRKETK